MPVPSSTPVVLGYAGLLPFLFALTLALSATSVLQQELAVKAFVCYGAVILAFLGGVRWGAALSAPTARQMVLAVAPSLIAFLALMLPVSYALQFNALLFLVVGLFDVLRPLTPEWPIWYRRLRVQLSIGVLAMHVIMIVLLP